MKLHYWVIVFLLLLPSLCRSEEEKPGRIVLLTEYCQQGWGDLVQIGCMDENGGLFSLEGTQTQLHWPVEVEKKRTFLETSGELRFLGKLDGENRFALMSLVSSVEDQGDVCVDSGGDDMGMESTYAIRYSRDGTPKVILLGGSGDHFFENRDPSAQTLYLWARRLFPTIRSYAYGKEGIGPEGFAPQALTSFLGIPASAVDSAEISCVLMDCEAGPIPVELSDEEKSAIRELLRFGKVTGKANSISVTGGTRSYGIRDPEGKLLGWIELYEGLLVHQDGMYWIGTEAADVGMFQVSPAE